MSHPGRAVLEADTRPSNSLGMAAMIASLSVDCSGFKKLFMSSSFNGLKVAIQRRFLHYGTEHKSIWMAADRDLRMELPSRLIMSGQLARTNARSRSGDAVERPA